MRLLLFSHDKFELVVLDKIVRAALKNNTSHQRIWSGYWMFDSNETRTMIDRTSRYTLLKYFSDGCTAIYLSHRFSARGGYGIKKRLQLFSHHLCESHRYCMGHWYIGRVSIVTKSAGTRRTYQWRVSGKEDWTQDSRSSSKWFDGETSSETFSFPRRVQDDDTPTFWTPPLSC